MKMTMHIDEGLLEEVIDEYGFASKTEAVETALKEMNRRSKLRKFAETGIGLTAAELKASAVAGYDANEIREVEFAEGLKAAEEPARYGKRARSR
ncbi:MAG: type II toxin-antitoxin system VapB family antitoxin [Verrucomicrobiales bacterium]